MPTLWIKDPLAIMAEGAERGIVVRNTRIVERVGKGREPSTPVGESCGATTSLTTVTSTPGMTSVMVVSSCKRSGRLRAWRSTRFQS